MEYQGNFIVHEPNRDGLGRMVKRAQYDDIKTIASGDSAREAVRRAIADGKLTEPGVYTVTRSYSDSSCGAFLVLVSRPEVLVVE